MIIFVVGILLIIYSIESKQRYSVRMGMLFVLLIIGFQEGLQTDYPNYMNTYNSGGAGMDSWSDTTKEGEFSYIWITQLCSRIMSFHMFVFLTSVIQCLAMGLMIKRYAAKQFSQFGVLLVFFTVNIMLIQMTAMRQAYAADCLLLAYYLLGRKKYFLSIIIAVIAYGFHNSTLVVLPFFVVLWVLMYLRRKDKIDNIGSVVIKKSKGLAMALWVAVGLFGFYLVKYVFFASYINPILEGLEMFSYSGYLDQFEKDAIISWWILLYHAVIVFFVTLYCVNEHDLYRRYLGILVIVSMFLDIGTFGFGNLMRVGMYFVIFSIVVYPNITAMLHFSYGKPAALAFVLFNMAYLMLFSVKNMLSRDYSSATGFYSYTFSFLNW